MRFNLPDISNSLLRQGGFSFLELCFVLIVISFLIYIGTGFYFMEIDKAEKEALRTQANSFSRTVDSLRASALISNKKYIDLDGKRIYLNEYGWPANTAASMSSKSFNQTAEECQQIWLALYKFPPPSILNIREKKSSSLYLISSINGRICRYELLTKQDVNSFFDYHLNTGVVRLVVN